MSGDTAPEVAAAEPVDQLRAIITLLVTHQVTVRLNSDSGKTMNELRDAALDEYHRDPGRYGSGTSRRTDDSWRAQFQNRSSISVSEERVAIAAVQTEPQNGARSW